MADGSLLFDTKVDTKGVEQGMNQVSNIAKGALAADLVKATTKAVGNLGKAAIETGKNFESSMSQVAATMGITSDEIQAGSKDFEMLRAKAKEMGATTKYTASEAAEGLNILAMAGLDAEEACAGIGDVMALAGAGAMSLEESATYVTGAVKGFNDEMENSGKYADIMAKGATMANTDVKGLGAALSGVSATATAYNQSVESTSVALLRLAEQNVTGAEAATSLSRVMADLYTPTDKAAQALKKLGISTYDEAGNARDLNDVVDELNVALAGMSDEEKLAYENTIFTTFGMKGFQKMCVSSTEKVDQFKEGIADAAGSAMEQFATQTDNLEGKLAILNSALEATGIAVYEVFGEELQDAVEGATDVVDRLHDSIENGELHDSFEHLADSLGDFIENALELGESALPILINALAFLLDNAGALVAGLATYEAVTLAATIATTGFTTALMANPIGLIAVAAATAVTGISMLVGEVRNLTDETKEIAEGARDATEKSQRLAESAKSSADGFRAESTYVKSLVEQLKACTDAEGKITGNRREAESIVNQLNTAVEGLNLSIDEETGMLIDATGAWENYIDTQMKQAQAAAISEKLKDIESQRLDNEIEKQKIVNELSEDAIDVLERKAKMDELALKDAAEWTQEEVDAWEDYGEAVQNVTDDEWALIQQHQELDGVTEELNDSTDLLNEYMEDLAVTEVDATDAAEDLAEGQNELADATNEVTEALEKETESLTETLEKQVNSFDAVAKAAEQNKADILQNLADQRQAMEDWAENMQILASRGVDDGILAKLANMGPEGAGYVQAFVDMTGDELSQAATDFQQALAISDSTAQWLANEYMTAGTNATQQWINGAWQEIPKAQEMPTEIVNSFVGSAEWNRMSPEVQAKVREALEAGQQEASSSGKAEEVPRTMVDRLMNSPEWDKLPNSVREKISNANQVAADESEKLYDSGFDGGEKYGQGHVDGVDSKQDEVRNADSRLAEEGIKGFETEAGISGGGTSSVMERDGAGMARGVAQGIQSQTGEVVNAATSMGRQAVTAAHNAAPRSEFESIGINMASGMAAGIKSGENEVTRAAREVAEAAVKEAKASLKIKSPSKVFEEIGAYCVAGFNKGMDAGAVENAMNATIQTALGDTVSDINGTRGGFTQINNIYSQAQSADELARELRLETKYGWAANMD